MYPVIINYSGLSLAEVLEASEEALEVSVNVIPTPESSSNLGRCFVKFQYYFDSTNLKSQDDIHRTLHPPDYIHFFHLCK